MRPVTRTPAPQVYTKYQDAIGDLENCFGRYCSYCERSLQIGLAVEHVVAKHLDRNRERDWTNFLLACGNCNSVKGTKPTNDTDFFWPDRDNTLLALMYTTGGLVKPSAALVGASRIKATNLIDLVGLDRHPGQPVGKRPAERDRRYMDREEVWALAKGKHDALARNDNEDFRVAIVDLAKASGFFSVWMSVFENDFDMRGRLVSALNGTAADCFDGTWKCVPRPGGQL